MKEDKEFNNLLIAFFLGGFGLGVAITQLLYTITEYYKVQ